jgi:hypothetical protein
MKNLIAITLFLPFISQASIVPLFRSEIVSQPTNFNKPVIYKFHASENKSLSRRKIIQIQKRLRVKGFYNGKVNGRLTFQTKRSLENFQAHNNIHIRGTITTATLSLLNKTRSTIASN